MPKQRKNEIVNRIKEGLKDLSISRTSFDWGVPFPLDKKHVVYVWYDALFNYLSGAGKNKKYWPAELHLLGKDNSCFMQDWPALNQQDEMPKTVFVHGFLHLMDKNIKPLKCNIPKILVEKYGQIV